MNIVHGTFHVIDLQMSPNLIVASIDSRKILSSPSGDLVRDDWCKIFPLDDQTLFFGTGVADGSPVDGAELLNSPTLPTNMKLAKRAFQRAGGMEGAASIWAADMTNWLNAYGGMGHFAHGYFLGRAQGRLKVYGVEIRPNQGRYAYEIFEPPDHNVAHEGTEFLGILERYFNLTPSNVAALMREIQEPSGTPEWFAARAKMAVEAVIREGKDIGIGGQAATVILEPGKNWRWYKPPQFCVDAAKQ